LTEFRHSLWPHPWTIGSPLADRYRHKLPAVRFFRWPMRHAGCGRHVPRYLRWAATSAASRMWRSGGPLSWPRRPAAIWPAGSLHHGWTV